MSQTASPKRADARRNIEAIIEAATRLLAADPDVSLNDIARAAGVGRVTLYAHFESRSALLRVVTDRAMAATESALSHLDLGGDPREALARVLTATWDLAHRYGALVVAASHALAEGDLAEVHAGPVIRVEALLGRGRDIGAFRTDMPIAWQVSALQAIVHAAAGAVHRGDIAPQDAPRLVRDSALAIVSVDPCPG